jgi:uncharacterized protein
MSHDIDHREIQVTTDDGCVLDGDLALPRSPVASASVLHPHPRMGGARHNGVVEAIFRALPRHGVAAVRVDFRGVGRSSGTYGGGDGERHDAAAALEAASEAVPGRAVWSIGYSFGGDLALSVDHPSLAGWVAVAPPLAVVTEEPPASGVGRPTTLVVPAHDQFNPPHLARSSTSGWADTTIVEIPMADHFLVGRLDAVVEAVVDAVRRSA